MKKIMAYVLALLCIVSLIGCGKQSQPEAHTKNLPVPMYPLRKESITEAIKTAGLPEDLTIEEETPHRAEGAESTLYILRHPTLDLPDSVCMEIISHKYGESNIPELNNCSILGIGFASIDQDAVFSREEAAQAIRFASYLFWEDEQDTRLYDSFIKEFDAFVENEEHYRQTHGGASPFMEGQLDGVQYILAYTPIEEQMKFKIRFSAPVTNSKE